MRRTTMLWEVFVRRFEEAFGQDRRRRLTGEEAGELLGMSGRHFRRLCMRYEEDAIEGLRDRRIDTCRRTARRLASLIGCTRFIGSATAVTRLSLEAVGLVAKAKRRGAHRKKRARRPLPGMLLFQDGSTHRWIAAERDLDPRGSRRRC